MTVAAIERARGERASFAMRAQARRRSPNSSSCTRAHSRPRESCQFSTARRSSGCTDGAGGAIPRGKQARASGRDFPTRERKRTRGCAGAGAPAWQAAAAAQPPRSGDAFGSKQNVTVVHAPEDVPPDAENVEEDSRIPVETERCPEPRTAKSRQRSRRSRGSEGGAHVSGWGPVRRLLWRTRPRPARARHKATESRNLDA